MEDFLKISKRDLKASHLLYKNGFHAQSYFYFQQASEKANKFMSVSLGLLSEDKLQSISHDQIKPYRKALVVEKARLLEQVEFINLVPQFTTHPHFKPSELKEIHDSMNQGERFLDSLRSKDLVRISGHELNYLLKFLEDLKKEKVPINKNNLENYKSSLDELADWIGSFEVEKAVDQKAQIKQLLNDKDSFSEFVGVMTDFWKMALELIYAQAVLGVCAYITIRHSSKSRYPGEESPLKIYTKKLPLVRKQPEFMAHLENVYPLLKKYDKMFRRQSPT